MTLTFDLMTSGSMRAEGLPYTVAYAYTKFGGKKLVVTARGYAKRSICRRRVSVCVCLSHSGIVSKRLNVGSRK